MTTILALPAGWVSQAHTVIGSLAFATALGVGWMVDGTSLMQQQIGQSSGSHQSQPRKFSRQAREEYSVGLSCGC
nr:hypothetical protein L203_05937 [Cryptococcus depauperatus CBS 7841]